MKISVRPLVIILLPFVMASCVTQKKYAALQTDLQKTKEQLQACNEQRDLCKSDLAICRNTLSGKEEQNNLLKDQLADCKVQRDKQLTQVGDLTVLTKSANDNINQTLAQLENKDKYIQMLLAAKTKADSINLALAINLKGVLKDGLDDQDVEIKVDKTVVFINLSDKMLYTTGSYTLTAKAKQVLGKIAAIVATRPEVEVMVEGYTDNKSISSTCIADNWDLSVKRATSVVRVLQNDYKIDPNKLIAAGRGEYNALAGNDTAEGRATNRRTRIIIMPKLNQFYDLLDPTKAGK
ncbi:MAG: OmpA family protein [Chitinophagales bacterium]